LLASVLFLNQLVDTSERQYRRGKREQQQCIRGREIWNDQLADNGEYREQNYGPHLNDCFPALGYHQERSLELEGDDDREDHAKYGLKNDLISGIESNDTEEDFDCQIPNDYDYDDGDQPGQDQKNEMLELLVNRQSAPSHARRCEIFLRGHRGPTCERPLLPPVCLT